MRLAEHRINDLWILMNSENDIVLHTNDESQLPYVRQHMQAAQSASFGWKLLHYRLESVVNNISHKEVDNVSDRAVEENRVG